MNSKKEIFKELNNDDSSNELEQIIEIPWNSDSIHLDNIEIDFDDNLVYIFINGKMVKIEMLKTKFSRTEQTLELCGLKSAQYSFDEIKNAYIQKILNFQKNNLQNIRLKNHI